MVRYIQNKTKLFDEKKKQLRVYTFRIMPYNDALTFLFLCLQYV